jgi:hypothetical protein
MAKEAEEDIDPSELRRRVLTQPVVAKQTFSSRIGMHLADFRDAVRWKIEDGAHAICKFARQVRRHGIEV